MSMAQSATPYTLTFLFSFAENRIALGDGQQGDVVVVDDVLRGVRSGCGCTRSRRLSSSVERRTCGGKRRRGLELIARSCPAGELHAVCEQCR